MRIAVVGAGVIGRTHVATLARAPGLQLSALVEPGPGGTALAAELGVPCYRDVAELIAAGAADAAIVATPNETHLPVAGALLRAALPVLLEKPVAESLASALALADLAEATGVPLLIGHHRRHNPITRAAKSAIDAGEIGDLVAASVTCSLKKDDAYFDAAWRRQKGAGGVLSINLIHEIDLLRHFFGEIAEVRALTSHARRGFAVEDGAAVALRFAAGGLATLVISDAAAGPWAWDLTSGENPARFPAHPVSAHHYAGSRAGLSLPDLTFWSHPGPWDWTAQMHPRALPHSPGDPYLAQLAHFADLVAGRTTEPLVSVRDAVANIAAIEAIAEAARTGRAVVPAPTARSEEARA